MLPGQLNQALSNGQTVIVNVNSHFIIVDSKVTMNGVDYYMTRDPSQGPRGVLASILDSAMSVGVNAITIGK
jgi:filamentous hemagglutinin